MNPENEQVIAINRPVTYLIALYKRNSTIISNSISLMGTTVATSGLGFVYWWLAAQFFSQEAVGLASAAISSMMLIATISILGMGSLLVGELARTPEHTSKLITTTVLTSGLVSLVIGIAFSLLIPVLSPELSFFSQDIGYILLFTGGIILTTTSLLIDQAVVGLFQSRLQLWRNIVFAVAKLVALFIAGFILVEGSIAIGIYATWAIGALLSLLFVAVLLSKNGIPYIDIPSPSLLKRFGGVALGHHMLNLAARAPSLIAPLIVTSLLGAEINASFYVAFMIANFTFVVPSALTTVLYAVGAADPVALADKVRFTLRTSFILGIVSTIGIFLVANPVLSLFGAEYAQQADWALRFLAIGVFPMTVREHYIALYRIYKEFQKPTLLITANGIFQVTMIVISAMMGGLTGMTIGWLLANFVESIFMWSTVRKSAKS